MATYRTGQKTRLTEYLSLNSQKALTFEDICRALLSDGHGKSTVYRLLSELVEEGRVRKLFDGDGRRFVYQYICNEACASHLHLKCRICGKMVHLGDGITRTFESQIMRSEHFSLDDETVLLGKCEKCMSRDLLLRRNQISKGNTK